MVWGTFWRNCSHEFSSPTLVWRNYFAFDTLFPSLLYGWIFLRFATSNFPIMAKASLHIPHFGMAEFFRKRQPKIAKYFSSYFGMVEIFCDLQLQIAKIFSLARQMCKILPIWRHKGLSDLWQICQNGEAGLDNLKDTNRKNKNFSKQQVRNDSFAEARRFFTGNGDKA